MLRQNELKAVDKEQIREMGIFLAKNSQSRIYDYLPGFYKQKKQKKILFTKENKMQSPTLLKLINYKGAISCHWKAPKTEKQVLTSIKQLIKFFYRCKEASLLLPDVTKAIKSYAEKLIELAGIMIIVNPELISALKEIKNTPENGLEPEIIQEKKRVHKTAKCSLCRVVLRYPAYIVWRKGLEVVKTSQPVGILCLNNRVRILNNLIADIQVTISEERKKPHGYEAEKGSLFYCPTKTEPSFPTSTT